MLNFDLSTGKHLAIEQLFPSSHCIENVEKWLSSRPLESRSHTMKEEKQKGEPMYAEIAPSEVVTSRLVLLIEGLRIIFSPYEKASFSSVIMTITIPLTKFKTLGISDNLWQ